MASLVLKLKSTKAYLYIQKEGQLPIPSMNTIRRMLSTTERKFSFNDLVFKTAKNFL
jgi:hypothetical protein